MKDFLIGWHYILFGFKMIFATTNFRRYVFLPLLINILLYIGIFFLFTFWVHRFNDWLSMLLPTWLGWLNIVIWLIFIVAFFVLTFTTFALIANIIASPFNNLLSEEVLIHLSTHHNIETSLLGDLKEIPNAIANQIKVMFFYYLPRMLIISILFFMPVIQIIAPIVSFLFQAWTMTLSYLTYPASTKKFSFTELQRWLLNKRLKGLGFGMGVIFFTIIPGLNFFIMPAAVIAASKWWSDEIKESS